MRALLAALLLVSAGALAQPASSLYPARPVRAVVPFAPGGPADIVARLLGQRLGEHWGQQLIVENRPGAGGNVASAATAKAPPDGYTVLITTSAAAVNMSLSAEPGFDIERDFVPVINVASSPNLIVTHPSGAATLRELIERARGPGLVYGSPGTGTTPHLTAEYLFKNLAGLKVTHVPYKGGAPVVAAALSNEVPVVSVAMPAAVPHLKAGKLRGLAITSARRAAMLPEVPTVQESGFQEFEDYTWVGVFLPAAAPAAVAAKINTDVNAALADATVRERLAAVGFEPVGGSPESFAVYLRREVAKWARVVRATGAKGE